MKPKVLLDIAILGHGFDKKSARRGVERQVDHLFEGLLKSDFCDTSFTATSFLAGTYDFLRANGVEPEERLKFHPGQLSRGRIARRFVRKVYRTMENRGLAARASRKALSLAARWLTGDEADIDGRFLSDADIYHTPLIPYPLLPFPSAVQNNHRIKKFVTIHDLFVMNPKFFETHDGRYVRRMLDCFTKTTFAFCTSESVRADILKFTSLQPERIFMAPPAADRNLFSPVNDPQIRAAALKESGIPDAPYFLALSVPERHKNFGHLIQCLDALLYSRELAGHNLVIVGRDAVRNKFFRDALSKHPKTTGHIVTPGFVPDEKLAAIYSGATAFLFPSLAEGFGLPPLEAMQCGVPVISSNTTSMPEVVGDAGILLPPTDVDGWCQAMLKVSRDEKLRKEMAAKSIERAKLFSWERYIEAVIRGYRTSLEFKD